MSFRTRSQRAASARTHAAMMRRDAASRRYQRADKAVARVSEEEESLVYLRSVWGDRADIREAFRQNAREWDVALGEFHAADAAWDEAYQAAYAARYQAAARLTRRERAAARYSAGGAL